ncbi:unnamed protein product, partial [Polarella glacialis]
MESETMLPSYVLSWGANECGQCMQSPGRSEDSGRCLQPTLVDSLSKRQVGQVFAGYDYSCVITGTERLWAAGSNSGFLFRDDEESSQECAPVGFEELEASRLVAVSGGRDHLVSVTDSGTAISWGRSNEFGQVGHGQAGLQRSHPAPVRGMPPLYKVVAVACGEYSTVALLASGELFAWGANDLGQLGIGDTEPRKVPTRVAGAAHGVPFRAVAAGHQHCLGLSRGGRVYAWGSNRHGRLGLGSAAGGDAGGSSASNCVPSPVLVADVPYAKHISGGGSHSAVLVQKGRLLSCGDNRCGQLGRPCNEALPFLSSFTEVTALSSRVRLVECGARHTICLTFEGIVVGFGANSEGQLGTGRTSEFEESPVQAEVERCAEGRRLLIYALAVTMDHSCALAIPAPAQRDQLDRYLSEGTGITLATIRHKAPERFQSRGRRDFIPPERTVSFGGLGRLGKVVCDEDGGLARTVSTPLPSSCRRPSPKRCQIEQVPLAGTFTAIAEEPAKEDGGVEQLPRAPRLLAGSQSSPGASTAGQLVEEVAATDDDQVLHPSLSQGCLSPLTRKHSCVKFHLAADSEKESDEEVVLLKPLVHPGVASKAFASLSAGDLLEQVRAARRSGEWRAASCTLCAVLRSPVLLNASFHFPGLREPRVDAETLHEALELMAEAPFSVHLSVLEAAEEGLREFNVPSARLSAMTQEQLRGLLVPLLLPQLRDTHLPQQRRQAVLSQAALLVASLSPKERRLLLDLLVTEIPQASILSSALVPAVRHFLNERIHSLAARQSMDDPGLWHGMLLMQLLFLANEKLRDEQSLELELYGASHATLQHRFLRLSEFQISALDEATIPPQVAFQQLVQTPGCFGLLGSTARWLPSLDEIVFGEASVLDPKTMWLPPGLCILLMHRNLVPVAFKQKVLQVSNSLKQRSLQDRNLGPLQILAMMAGQDARLCVLLQVRRECIVEDTVDFLHKVEPVQLHLPLKVQFVGEDGLDEGGVRREFFQVLVRQLFDQSYAMFTRDPNAHTTWFSTLALDNGDTNFLFKACGTVIGLAIYNNEDGIQIQFPLALFKKLKGEALNLSDLQDIHPEVWMSMQQLLSWTPATGDPNREFEDIFCLTFAITYDFFGEMRTEALKEGGEDLLVNFDNRREYVDLRCKWILEKSVERQFKILAEGFNQVVDSALWSLLTAQEAYLMVCSEPDLDIADLRRGARYDGYRDDEPYIQGFWEILEGFDVVQRKKFLAFTTGCDRAPLGGLHELKMSLQKNGAETTDRLPTAHTCFNM